MGNSESQPELNPSLRRKNLNNIQQKQKQNIKINQNRNNNYNIPEDVEFINYDKNGAYINTLEQKRYEEQRQQQYLRQQEYQRQQQLQQQEYIRQQQLQQQEYIRQQQLQKQQEQIRHKQIIQNGYQQNRQDMMFNGRPQPRDINYENSQRMQEIVTSRNTLINDFRNIHTNMDQQQRPLELPYQPYPLSSSTTIMKREMPTVNLTPYNFQEQVDEYNRYQEDEVKQFEDEEMKRRKEFQDYLNKKKEYLEREIKKFEANYNPYEILGLSSKTNDDREIKKAYKRMALKYHPDKVGDKYKDQFQLITQAYVYLLNKLEEEKTIKEKTTREVKHSKYRDDINEDGIENIYISKDKFDINKFNEIFEKYQVPEESNEGYGHLYEEEMLEDNSNIFSSNFNKEIFNATFDDIKKNKKTSTDLISINTPEALDSNKLGFTELGSGRSKDFSGRSSVQYTDYKRAHLDENVLIDPNNVKQRKEYRNVDQLKSDRENPNNLVYSVEDTLREQAYERMRAEKEAKRLEKLRERDQMMESHYNKMNQKLIIHK